MRLLGLDDPLRPTSEEARRLLQRELLKPEYRERNWLWEFIAWLEAKVFAGASRVSDLPNANVFIGLVLFGLFSCCLAWMFLQLRMRRRRRHQPGAALLVEDGVNADEVRARAERAFADGDAELAVVEGYRAMALRQVERGAIEPQPGATAHEIARELAAAQPARAERVLSAAGIFDTVLYGKRSASLSQARLVLDLDRELAGAR